MKSPFLKYPGAKWRLAEWICGNMPKAKHYVEPFCGSAAVYMNLPYKPQLAILNDYNSDIFNLFQVLRESPEELKRKLEFTPWSRQEYELSYVKTEDAIENARRFLVSHWQGFGRRQVNRNGWRNNGPDSVEHGNNCNNAWKKIPELIDGLTDKLRDAQIENRPALEVIARHDSRHTLFYVDPPYLLHTRKGKKIYKHEMTIAQHAELLEALLKCKGVVMLSGYDDPIYDYNLRKWQRLEKTTTTQSGGVSREILWINRKSNLVQRPLF